MRESAPLLGHTMGRCGLAVQSAQAWLLHAGDAYFYNREVRGAWLKNHA